MTIELSLHDVAGIEAEYADTGGTFWVSLKVKTFDRRTRKTSEPLELCLFMTNRETAKAYANAINGAERAELTVIDGGAA